ncbi:hypothetical protein NHJ13734_007886 [Beauveria thailandica]
MSQQQLPFGYLSQIDSYMASVNAFTAPPYLSQIDSYMASVNALTAPPQPQPAAQSPLPPTPPPPPPTPPSSALLTTTSLPDCFRTPRCDGCEMLFAEAVPDELRWTFPCRHVYCVACAAHARAAALRSNVFCHRCANIIVRRLDNPPCTHQIPAVAFDVRRPDAFPGFPERYRLALGQRTGPKCQRCWLVARLQNVSYTIAQRYRVQDWGFPGELYACVQVDRQRMVHGMRRELPDVEVDKEGDVELCTAGIRDELSQIASDICGGLGQVPMEPNFDPRGHIVVQYRLRGFAQWMSNNGIDEKSMPVGLRAAVYGEWT